MTEVGSALLCFAFSEGIIWILAIIVSLSRTPVIWKCWQEILFLFSASRQADEQQALGSTKFKIAQMWCWIKISTLFAPKRSRLHELEGDRVGFCTGRALSLE